MGTKARSTKESEFLAMRAERLHEIRTRLADLIEEDPVNLASDLADLSLSIIAQAHPSALTVEEKEKIRHSAPFMTDALIDERAMAEEGVLQTLATHLRTCRDALQCFPESDCRPILGEREELPSFLAEFLMPSLNGTFDSAVRAGMHPLSVATIIILLGTIQASKQGVPWSLLVQPFLTAINHAIEPAREEQYQKSLDSAICLAMEERGISRPEARRYIMRLMRDISY